VPPSPVRAASTAESSVAATMTSARENGPPCGRPLARTPDRAARFHRRPLQPDHREPAHRTERDGIREPRERASAPLAPPGPPHPSAAPATSR
jgi:hypothetical protein